MRGRGCFDIAACGYDAVAGYADDVIASYTYTCDDDLIGFDRETNLNYNYFRDYDPSTGRYVQSDPIGLRGGINTYSYVEGDPLSLVDPEGFQGHSPSTGQYRSSAQPNLAAMQNVASTAKNYLWKSQSLWHGNCCLGWAQAAGTRRIYPPDFSSRCSSSSRRACASSSSSLNDLKP